MTVLREGYVTDAETELQFRAIRSEQDYWQEQLSNPQALHAHPEAAAEKFVVQLKQPDKLFGWGGIWPLTSEQTRQMLGTLLREFLSYRDGEVELRFKLPVSGKQAADTIATLS